MDLQEQIEELKQENYSLKQKVIEVNNDEWYWEEISRMEKENADKIESMEREHKKQFSEYNKKIQDLREELEESLDREKHLIDKIKEMEETVHDKTTYTTMNMSHSFSTDEKNQQEILDLQNENVMLKETLEEAQVEIQNVTSALDTLKKTVASQQDELEKAKCTISSYSSRLEAAKMENTELKMEMESLEVADRDMDQKGNSLFSEVEDRRVQAEKVLISMKKSNEVMKEKYMLERQERHKVQRQLLLSLSRGGGEDRERVTQLQQHLESEQELTKQLKMEIISLKEKQVSQSDHIKELMAVKGDHSESNDMVDKNYAEYCVKLLKSKEEELKKCMEDMKTQDMVLLSRKHTIFDLEKEVAKDQKEKEKLQRQLFQLKLNLQDMKMKYEPESLKPEEKRYYEEKNLKKESTVKDRTDDSISLYTTDDAKENRDNISNLGSNNAPPNCEFKSANMPLQSLLPRNKVSFSDCVFVLDGEDKETSTILSQQSGKEPQLNIPCVTETERKKSREEQAKEDCKVQ